MGVGFFSEEPLVAAEWFLRGAEGFRGPAMKPQRSRLSWNRRAGAIKVGASAVLASSGIAAVTDYAVAQTSTPSSRPDIVDGNTPSALHDALNDSPPSHPLALPPGVSGSQFSAFVEQIAGHFGSRYGGMWFDTNSTPTRLVFGIVGLTPADCAFVATAAGPHASMVAIQGLQFSARDLQRYSQAIAEQFAGPGKPVGSTDINYQKNKVIVMTSVTGTALSDLANGIAVIVPGGAVEIVQVGQISYHTTAFSTQSGRNTYSPYKGGLQVTDGVISCTTGFDFVLNGTDMGSSSGHCFGLGDGVWVPGSADSSKSSPMGATFARGNPLHDDVLYSLKPSTGTGTVLESPGYYYNIASVIHNGSFSPGLPMCYSGDTTGENCGVVQLVGENYPYQDLVCGSAIPNYGDSGAPAYKVEPGNNNYIYAEGLISGVLTVESGGTIVSYGCMQPVDDVTSDTGATVQLNA